MIDEDRTQELYGYKSTDLSPNSGKPIVRICEDCGRYTIMSKQAYQNLKYGLCNSCAKKSEKNSNYGRLGENNPLYGRVHNNETLNKMSVLAKRRNVKFGKNAPN